MHSQRRFALDLQFYLHTTLSPHTKPVPTCVNTGLTCMLCGARTPRPPRLPPAPAPAAAPLPALPARGATGTLVQLGSDSGLERGGIRHPRNVLAADNVERLVTLSQQVH